MAILLLDLCGVVLKSNEMPGAFCIVNNFSLLSGLPPPEVRSRIGLANEGLHKELGLGLISNEEFHKKICEILNISISF